MIGLGINFTVKANPRIERVIKIDERVFRIDINKAAYEDLLRIQGVTPKLAKKIIEYRQSHGLFRDVEELKEIKSIGNYRYEKLRNSFFVD